jgi:hypothetical protein
MPGKTTAGSTLVGNFDDELARGSVRTFDPRTISAFHRGVGQTDVPVIEVVDEPIRGFVRGGVFRTPQGLAGTAKCDVDGIDGWTAPTTDLHCG